MTRSTSVASARRLPPTSGRWFRGTALRPLYQDGDTDALSASAIRGLALFTGKANCKTCHTGFNFTDEDYNNIGVGMGKPEPDVGRYEVTKSDADRGKFKTPTLRNVALSAPYMHDGSEETLEDVIAFYDQGGIPNPNLSKEIKP